MKMDYLDLYEAISDVVDKSEFPDLDSVDESEFAEWLQYRYEPIELLNLVLNRLAVAKLVLSDDTAIILPEVNNTAFTAWKKVIK